MTNLTNAQKLIQQALNKNNNEIKRLEAGIEEREDQLENHIAACNELITEMKNQNTEYQGAMVLLEPEEGEAVEPRKEDWELRLAGEQRYETLPLSFHFTAKADRAGIQFHGVKREADVLVTWDDPANTNAINQTDYSHKDSLSYLNDGTWVIIDIHKE